MNFKEFGLAPELLKGIEAIGYDTATPVQEQTIPHILKGNDLIASAQTGTGKTAAFLLPVIHKIITSKQEKCIRAMVIVPTRELAIQIDQQMEGFSYFTPVSSIAVYGGTDGATFSNEQQSIMEGVDVIICTPGRMIAHLNLGYVKVPELKYFILDEADRMLDMGFHDDIMKIISHLPKQRQNLMFAATMPESIRILAKKVLNNPAEINIAISKPAEKILQLAYVVYESQKNPLIKYILQSKQLRSAIIFCSTKSNTKQLCKELKKTGLNIEEIHSDLDQKDREKILTLFKNKELNILVATDILSRGIDVEDIDLIINYNVPNDGEDYIHRIGRTARAEADGVAITIISQGEQNRFFEIEKLIGKTVHKAQLPVQFGDIPEYNPRESYGRKVYRRKGAKKR